MGRHVSANLAEPFVRSECQKIVSADDGHFHLHRISERFGEPLRRVCHLLEGKLQALLVAHVEIAAIMEPRQGVATVNLIQLLVLLDFLFGRFSVALYLRHFAEISQKTLVFRGRFILSVEDDIGKFGSQLQGSEEERNCFLYETALLVMVPEQELDISDVDFLRVVRRVIFVERTLDEFAFFLIERNVGAVALLAFFCESLPDACARNHIFEITGNAECQLLGVIHILEVMGVARLVKSMVYFVGEFCIIQICFVCFFVWMQSNPFLGENNFFHIFQVFLVICLL